MPRRQAGLAAKARNSADSPLRQYNRSLIGRVIHTYPKDGLVDIALNRGVILRRVPVLVDGIGSTRSAQQALPQVWNSDKAFVTYSPDGDKLIYDEPDKTYRWDTFAVVQYLDGYHNNPVVTGFFNPNSHQGSMPEANLELTRHTSDIHELHFTEEGIDVRPLPFGDAAPGHPDEVYGGNWQVVFPDRQKDYKVPYGGKRYGWDHQTYLSAGQHDRPRVFGDGNVSANYDNDKNPWKLMQTEQGDDPQTYKYARGVWINQRWRSRFGIDQQGNVEIRAEGLDWDSTGFREQTISQGNIQFWSRLNTTAWNKHYGAWTRMRPRQDGGGSEDIVTAKKTGTAQQRIQRFWDVAVRKDAEFRVKDTFTLKVGDFDSKWNTGDLGDDPGIHWDDNVPAGEDKVLNPAFKQSVDSDIIWKGEDFQDSANVVYHFRRWAQAKATGPQTFTWTLDPQQLGTDAQWTLALTPNQGNVLVDTELTPSAHKTADWKCHLQGQYPVHLDLHDDENGATASLNLTAPCPITLSATAAKTSAEVDLLVTGAHPISLTLRSDLTHGYGSLQFTGTGTPVGITFDTTTGIVNITGTLTVNGTVMAVP